MIKHTRHHKTELAVIGAGIAGCAATVFAEARGIKTTQVGNTGALAYTTGFFDLLGVANGKHLKDPWQGLENLRQVEPDHPYARLSHKDIRDAFDEFISAVEAMGISYTAPGEENHLALLPAGATKPTYSMPATMQKMTQAIAKKARVLIVDFAGLQGFSAREIVANLANEWPGLSAKRISFPDMDCNAQLFPEVMARALEVRATREAFADILKEIAGDAEYIAMPAILGIYQPDKIHQDVESLLGLPIFEIPTIPPAVAGIRLRELFEQQLKQRGATVIAQQLVRNVSFSQGSITLSLQDNYGPVSIEANKVLLASGRFLSRGLLADQQQITEALIGLPIQQPKGRDDWFSEDYFDPQGHAVNRAGVRVNDSFQPVNASNEVVDERLYAAGIILANQDWIRQRCGAGLAIATAYRAVQAMLASR